MALLTDNVLYLTNQASPPENSSVFLWVSFPGQGKSMYPLSANANVLSVTPHLLVTR
jgi:hypothetical protein